MKKEGSMDAALAAEKAALSKQKPSFAPEFSADVEHALKTIAELIRTFVPADSLRWYAVKVFERDERVFAALNLPEEIRRRRRASRPPVRRRRMTTRSRSSQTSATSTFRIS